LNLLLEAEVMPSAHAKVTARLCEIRYGERRLQSSFDGLTWTDELTKWADTNPSAQVAAIFQKEKLQAKPKRYRLFWPAKILQVIQIFK
jgi:hypothetical protein